MADPSLDEQKGPIPPERQRDIVEADEVSFFAKYYEGQVYHPTGWLLRLRRELRTLLDFAGCDRLGKVLSLGCGDGQFELLLAPYATRVTGLDISPEAIELAQRNSATAGIDNVDFRCQALADIAWDEHFDAILCLSFLHHIPSRDLPGLFLLIHEHLTPGGLFYAIDPNARGILRTVGRVVMRDSYGRYHSPDERELYPEEISALLRTSGFEDVRTGYNDLTLIPALFLFPRGPSWPLRACAAVDQVWCRSPFARWSSAFTTFARRQTASV